MRGVRVQRDHIHIATQPLRNHYQFAIVNIAAQHVKPTFDVADSKLSFLTSVTIHIGTL